MKNAGGRGSGRIAVVVFLLGGGLLGGTGCRAFFTSFHLPSNSPLGSRLGDLIKNIKIISIYWEKSTFLIFDPINFLGSTKKHPKEGAEEY